MPKMKLILLMGALLTQSVFADETWILRLLENAQIEIGKLGGPERRCFSEPAPSVGFDQLNELFSKCATDICGPAQSNQVFSDLGLLNRKHQGLEIIKERYKADIADIIHDYIEMATREEKARAENVKKIFARSGNKIPLDPQTNYIRNLKTAWHFQKATKLKRIGRTFAFDPIATRANLNKLPETVADEIVKFYSQAFDHAIYGKRYLSNVSIQMRRIEPEIILKGYYPKLSLKDALLTDAKAYLPYLESVKSSPEYTALNKLGLLTDSVLDDESMHLASKGEELNADQLKRYFRVRNEVDRLLMYFQGLDRKYYTENLIFGTPEDFIRFTNLPERIEQFLTAMDSPDERKKLEAPIVEKCLSNYLTMMSQLPSEDEINQYDKTISQAKIQLRQKVLPYFSTETQLNLNSAINSIEIKNFAKSPDRYHQSFKTGLIGIKGDLFKSAPLTPETAANWDIYREYDMGRVLAKLNSYCRSQIIPAYSDKQLKGTSGIEVGWGSIKNPGIGKGNFMHEVGHLIEDVFEANQVSEKSKGKYLNTRACLNARYKGEPNYRPGFYESEDWADLVSALARNSTDPNNYCINLRKSADGENYVDLSLKNSNVNDVHSAALFRILHIEQVSRGTLPDSCMEAILKVKTPPNFSSCLQKGDPVIEAH